MKHVLIIIFSVLTSINLNSQAKSSIDFAVGVGNSFRVLDNTPLFVRVNREQETLHLVNEEARKMNWKS